MIGYDRQLSGEIIYWTSNSDSNVIYFSKCIYQHYTFDTTVKKFRFYQDGVTIEKGFTFYVQSCYKFTVGSMTYVYPLFEQY